MRPIRILVTLLLAVSVVASVAAGGPSEDDTAAMQRLAAEADARWNARDADGLSRMFSEDATLEIPGRSGATTREGIRAYFANSFAQLEPRTEHLTMLSGLILVTPDVVLADGRVRVDRVTADGGRELLRYFVNHTVMVKESSGWKFKAIRAHVHPNGDAPPLP